MTAVGGNLENKTIGLQFGVSGTFVDCELVNGKVQLKSTGTDSAGNTIYAETGTWTSNIIDIGDNFKEYGKLFASETKQGNSSIKLETRTSDDGVAFDEWETVASDGTIISTKRRRIQVRVTFYVAYDDANIYISKGNNSDDAKNVFNNEFIDTSNGITLKRDYNFEMTKDSSWSGIGGLYKKAISENDWYKINKVKVLPSEKLSKTLILSNNEYKKVYREKITSIDYNTIIPTMTSNITPSGIASASTELDIAYKAFKAFEPQEEVTFTWYSKSVPTILSPQWIAYEFPTKKEITSFAITGAVTNITASPKDFSIEGYDDSGNWITIQSYVNITDWNSTTNKEKFFTITNKTGMYKKYRILITANNGHATYTGMAYIKMFVSTVVNGLIIIETISSTLPTQEQFLSEGMDSLSPLLDRRVETLEPIKMNKSEILFQNETGQVFSKTLNLKAYMDIRKITPSSTNGKMVFKNTADNKYYIESSGSMVEVTDTSLANILLVGNSTITVPSDFYNIFGEDVDVLFYTSYTTLADLELTLEANWSPIDELEGDFEFVTWTDETNSTRTLEVNAIPSPQFIAKATLSDVKGNLNGILTEDLSTYTTSSNVRFLLTNNNSTWYKWDGANFVNVTYTKVSDILTLGNTYAELSNADYSKWTHSKINIGVFLKDDDITTSKVNQLGFATNSPIRTSQVSDLNFYILNTTAKIELDLKGLWLSGQLSDLDLTRVQYRVFLNEQPYYPLDGKFTNLDNPPLNIDITFKSEEIKINDWNTLRVEFKDSFGTVDYWQTTFVGNYSSLMFMDTDSNYYSDDVGKVLQYLDFGTFFGGQYSVEHEVVIKNQYGYDVENLMIEASTGHLPKGVEVQFSDAASPFTPQANLLLPNELKNDEEVSFYIRMISDIDSVPNGENKFNIFVKAERKV